MDNLLIIAIPFPTTKIVGAAIRLEKFIKYLTRLNWKVFGITSDWLLASDQSSPVDVLTTKVANPLNTFTGKGTLSGSPGKKNEPLKRSNIPGSINRVIRSFAKYLIVPDEFALWIFPSTYQARKIIKANHIQAVLSMSPYAACHIVAWIACWGNQCRWIADFRDPWVGNPMQPKKFFMSNLIDRFLQRMVIYSADAVTVNTHELALRFGNQYPSQKNKIKIIYNGYDPEDFAGMPGETIPFRPLILSHIGTIYGNRNPLLLINAIIDLKRKCPDLDERLVVNFVGYKHTGPEGINSLEIMALDKIIQINSVIPHREAIISMINSHILLLIPGFEYAIPGKIYEYMAARRPILSISNPESEVSNLIKRGRFGKVVSSVTELSNILLQLINTVDQQELNRVLDYDPDPIIIRAYSRAYQTDQLNSLLRNSILK